MEEACYVTPNIILFYAVLFMKSVKTLETWLTSEYSLKSVLKNIKYIIRQCVHSEFITERCCPIEYMLYYYSKISFYQY